MWRLIKGRLAIVAGSQYPLFKAHLLEGRSMRTSGPMKGNSPGLHCKLGQASCIKADVGEQPRSISLPGFRILLLRNIHYVHPFTHHGMRLSARELAAVENQQNVADLLT